MDKKISKRMPLEIPRGDAFSIAFAKYRDQDITEKVRQFLREPRYTVGDTGVSYRVINHWDQNDLLPEGVREAGNWRKFTFIEIVWLRAIVRLREFGLSIDKISTIRKCVMNWEKNERGYPLFEYYVVEGMASDSDPYIVTLPNGVANIATSSEIEVFKIMQKPQDILLISIKSILQELGLNVTGARILALLNDYEIDLITSIRSQKYSEAKVQLHDGNIDELETTETQSENPSISKIEGDIKNDKDYASVVSKFEQGKIQSAKIIRKKRFRK